MEYVWVFGRACRIPFMYCKNNKDPNIDPWGNPQFMVPTSEKAVANEKKKVLFVR